MKRAAGRPAGNEFLVPALSTVGFLLSSVLLNFTPGVFSARRGWR